MNTENKTILRLPLVRFAPFLAVGMLSAYYGGSLISAIVIGFSAAAFISLIILKKPLAINAAGLLCGALVMLGFVRLYAEPIIAFSGKTVETEFVADEIISHTNDRQEIIARLSLDGISTAARLTCEGGLSEGQRATALITFRECDPEWKTYNLASGTPLSGSAELLSIGDVSPASGIVRALRGLRRLFAGRVREFVSGETGELALSMLFGMDDKLPNALLEKLRICGAAHFTAVSGTHFSVFAALLLGMIPPEKRRQRALISVLFAPMAVIFFGASSSVIRASAMFLLYSVGSLFLRKSETLNTLCAAVTGICLISPASALDIGFQMSVLGVFGAGVVGVKASERLDVLLPKKEKKYAPLLKVLVVSVCAVICTAPLSAAVFKGVSVAGALTSIVLMPLMTVAFLFAILLGITGFGLLSVPLAAVMRLMLLLVDSLGSLRGLWLPTSFLGAWIVTALLAAAAAIWAMGSPRLIEVSANCAAVLMLLTLSGAIFAEGVRSEVLILENTQGSAEIVISGSAATVNIRRSSGNFSRTLLSALRENGARSLSEIIVEDESYSGAMTVAELLDAFDAFSESK